MAICCSPGSYRLRCWIVFDPKMLGRGESEGWPACRKGNFSLDRGRKRELLSCIGIIPFRRCSVIPNLDNKVTRVGVLALPLMALVFFLMTPLPVVHAKTNCIPGQCSACPYNNEEQACNSGGTGYDPCCQGCCGP